MPISTACLVTRFLPLTNLACQTIRVRERDRDTEPQRYALIGWSDTGLPLELCLVRTDFGVLIFHANYLTESFRKEFYQ